MATMKKAAKKSASKKMVTEKKTGGLKEMMKEYGPKKAFAMMKAKKK